MSPLDFEPLNKTSILETSKPGTLFCFGHGFSSRALAQRLIPKGWDVSGTCRDIDSKKLLNNEGQLYEYNGINIKKEIYDAIDRSTHLLISIPPQASDDPVLDRFSNEILNWQHLKWIGYISSTGVYGDAKGEWVDESSILRPATTINQRRVAIESAWLKLYEVNSLPIVIFRCVGIYGPGRNILISVKLGRSKRIEKHGLVFSRIHVDDLAQTLEASMLKPMPGEIYNVSDDQPSSPAEVVEYACSLLNVKPPPLIPYESAELSDMARGFYETNKRVSNKKIKVDLGICLEYPDYKVGLNALLKG
jgi:nucleoside-diphosphate-sugar epimerase